MKNITQNILVKFLTVAMLACLLVCCLLPMEARAASKEVNDARSSVLQVKLVYNDENIKDLTVATGTGFLINSNTLITCQHCTTLSAANKLKLAEITGKQVDQLDRYMSLAITVSRDITVPAMLVVESYEMDYAILRLANSLHGRTPLKLRSSSTVKQAEIVHTIGFPSLPAMQPSYNTYTSDDATITSGVVNKITIGQNDYSGANVWYIGTSCNLDNGNSGGPMIDHHGNAIGISQVIRNSNGESLTNSYNAIAIDQVIEVLDALGIVYEKATGNAAEVEPNGTLATGTMTTLGAPTTGALETKDDVDCYKFEIKERGYFTFTFNVDKLNFTDEQIRWGWDVSVYTSDGSKTIYSLKGVKEKFTTPKFAFEPNTYYVKVECNSESFAPVNVAYSVQVDFTADAYWEDEYNESREQAEKIALNTSYTGTMWNGDDVDYYEFNVSKDGFFQVAFDVNKLEFTAEQISWGWDLGVYDANGQRVYSYTGLKDSFTTPRFGLGKGKFYIGVKVNSSTFAPINVQYAVKAVFTASTVWESEDNGSRDVADSIKVGTKYTGNLLNKDDVDYYKFSHTNAGYFQVSLYIDKSIEADALSWGFELSVYDTAGKQIYTATGITATYTTPILPFAKGTYYIGVQAKSATFAPVHVDYQVAAKATKSAAWEIEHNNATSTATPVKHNTQYYGNMLHSKDADYYKLTLNNLCQISANLTVDAKFTSEQINQGWKITIYDTKGNTVFTAKDIVKNTTTAKVILKKGTYYVAVTADSSYSTPTLVTYGLKLNVKLAPPTVTVKSVGAKSLKLSWNSLGSGVTYKVYRATSAKGSYKLVKTTTARSFTDTNVSYGKAYFYKVIGSTSATAGTYSAVQKATVLAKATISKVKSTSESVSIKIAKVKGATGYTVYRSNTKNGSYKKIGTTKTTTYVDKTAKLGKVYYYKVRANGVSNGYGPFSAVVSGRALATPKVTAIKSAAKGINLKFAAIKGAVSYDIYRSTSSFGTFKKIANVKTTSYTDTNVKDNTTYYYKIVAKDANGGVSAQSTVYYCLKTK